MKFAVALCAKRNLLGLRRREMRFIKASNCDVAFAMQWHRPGRQKRIGGQKTLSTYTTSDGSIGGREWQQKSSRRSVSSLCVNRLCNRHRSLGSSIKLTFQTRLFREPRNKWDVKPLLQIESKLLCALLPPSLPASFRLLGQIFVFGEILVFLCCAFYLKNKKCFSSHL